MDWPFTETKGRLLREVECSYGSAARKKMTYPIGKEVTIRTWLDGSVNLNDGMYVVIHGAKPEDYEVIK